MSAPLTPIRCLVVEDSEDDALLVLRELKNAGYEVTSERVETAEAMREALTRAPWDLVLSDHHMPHFSGLAALEVLQASHLDLPFIIISGSIGEDIAVAAMKAGANSYLMKGRLASLGATVQHELANAAGRRARKQGEAELRASNERRRAILETAMDGFWLADRQGRLLEVNQTYARMSGYTVEELLRLKIPDLEANETATETAEHIERIVKNGEDRFEARHRRKDGSVFDVEVSVQHRPDDGGTLVCFLHDITEHRLAEEALRASLQEKEALLKEVHHRVKNNLQVITSLLRLESSRTEEGGARRVLKDMQGRIMSMALLHETLYRTGIFSRVDLANYLQRLASQLFRAQNVTPGQAVLVFELSSVQVDIDQAIPCGLIVNELLANSLRHAFRDGHGGHVTLHLEQETDGWVRMRVSDTGVGLAADFEARRSRSLGLQLVSDLARQLGGRLEVGSGPGAAFTTVFSPTERHGAG